jgi:hypothetical protein
MPRIVGFGSRTRRLSILAVILLFAFTPISSALLASSDASFAPVPYTSLAVRTPAIVPQGFELGDLIPVRLTNQTGDKRTYHWSASERGVVVSLGEITLDNGRAADINVPTNFASAGRLRISITGTDVFLTVPIVKT